MKFQQTELVILEPNQVLFFFQNTVNLLRTNKSWKRRLDREVQSDDDDDAKRIGKKVSALRTGLIWAFVVKSFSSFFKSSKVELERGAIFSVFDSHPWLCFYICVVSPSKRALILLFFCLLNCFRAERLCVELWFYRIGVKLWWFREVWERSQTEMPPEAEESIDIKFRLYDGSDMGPFRYSSASTIDCLKQRVLSDWPKGFTFPYSDLELLNIKLSTMVIPIVESLGLD